MCEENMCEDTKSTRDICVRVCMYRVGLGEEGGGVGGGGGGGGKKEMAKNLPALSWESSSHLHPQ